MGCWKKCCLLYLSMQFFCHSCYNSVKDNYFKCNEMSALMWTLPNRRSMTPWQTEMPEPSAITALSGNCPQIFETFLELINKCWFGLAGYCLVSLAGIALQWMALFCCSNYFSFLLKFPSATGRLINFNWCEYWIKDMTHFKEAFVGCLVCQTMHTLDYLAL